jgi:preprotein translocase subunit SecA
MERFGLQEGESLEHPWLNKSVETAQKRVEQRNYLIRKRALEFDDVMNKQRDVIYGWRNEAINSEDVRPLIYEVIDEAIPEKVISLLPPDDEKSYEGLGNWLNTTFPIGLTVEAAGFAGKNADEVSNILIEKIKKSYELKCAHEEPGAIRFLERHIMLSAIDRLWQEHLYGMDALREAVYLRAYGQKDPLIEFKNEAFEMFSELMTNVKGEILHNLFRSASNLLAFGNFMASLPQFLIAPDESGSTSQTHVPGSGSPEHRSPNPESDEPAPTIDDIIAAKIPPPPPASKVGRNAPCPCGSGKKYKNCCGRTA